MTAAVIIPFRDRGRDPLRPANLKRVTEHWKESGVPVYVVDDGRTGQFCRHAAYNRGAAATTAEVLVFCESDILIPHEQIQDAVRMATVTPGLVIPFSRQHKLNEADAELVRAYRKDPGDCTPAPHPYGEEGNTGCVNVVSRRTLAAVGKWDEQFDGHGHDDTAMYCAFATAAGPARRVAGPAYHLYHIDVDPDTTPDQDHLTDEDRAAQDRNFRRLQMYRKASTGDEIRRLTLGWPGSWRSRENDASAGRYHP